MTRKVYKPASAIFADALAETLTLEALASMPNGRLIRLALDLADLTDRVDEVIALRGIALEDAA